MSVALTSASLHARARALRAKSSRRVHSPRYGDGGHCACSPAVRSTACVTGRPVAPEEELPRERRAVELAQRERSHGATIVRSDRRHRKHLAQAFSRRTRNRNARPCAPRSSFSSSRRGAPGGRPPVVVAPLLPSRLLRAPSRVRGRRGHGRGRLRQERLDRPSRACRTEGDDAGRRRRCASSPRARRRSNAEGDPHRSAGGRGLRSLRADGKPGSRASLARRSEAARRRRNGRGSGRSRRPSRRSATRTWRSPSLGRSLSHDRPARRSTRAPGGPRPARSSTPTWSAACSSGCRARLPRPLGRHRHGRLPDGAGAPRLPGLGGTRPHGHHHRADAGRSLPASPSDARSRRPGRHMEISLARGVVLLVEDGKVVRAVHASTGSLGRTPTATSRSTPSRSTRGRSLSTCGCRWRPTSGAGSRCTSRPTCPRSPPRTAACGCRRARPYASTLRGRGYAGLRSLTAATVSSLWARPRLLV